MRAAAVHPDVWHAVSGRPFVFRLMGGGVLRPKNPVPGMDVAGVVLSIGASVTRFKPGDAVFGVTAFMLPVNGGTYAQCVCAKESMLAHKPSHVTFEEAASIPTPGIITLCNLHPQRIAQTDQVLINGGAGNVGSLAVQMAKARGAKVTAVDAPDKLAYVSSLGADRVIDYTKGSCLQDGARYDLIFDVATTLPEADAERALTANGRFAIVGHDQFGKATGAVLGSVPKMIRFMLRQRKRRKPGEESFKLPPVGRLIETLRQQLESRELMPVVGRTFALAQVADAMQAMEEGRVVGRIVLVP
jgi:NADPH:quinone reductase-like Zn-dependent oxidoreductase